MEFVREIIDTDKLVGIIDIPKKLRKSKVELILLPLEDFEEKRHIRKGEKKKSFKALYENPFRVKKINIPPRESLHER